eukprot:TRINITY_DN25987_c0_g1_i1.p1 TRINITY_DN25987_c0_g1~~TRINITY_DN25987_c0_g1_i1.p1  ORF type:complete len:406 (+),score=69.35 TRINITY_DN25987_c0_g1_i1:48-1265(+)
MKLPGIAARSAHGSEEQQFPSLLAAGIGAVAENSHLAKARLFREDFELIRSLGQGSFGEVRLVRYSHNACLYAMKTVDKAVLKDMSLSGDDRAPARAQAERDAGVAMTQSPCPFVIEFYASFQTAEKLYYIFEFCPGGDVWNLLLAQPECRFVESAAVFYVAELSLAVAHLHAHDVLHRDIKLENMLLASDNHVKLADFGQALIPISSKGARCSLNQSPEDDACLPPETQHGALIGKAFDCWQIGAALFCMLAGRRPSRKVDMALLPAVVSASATSICGALLEVNPEQRLGHPMGAAALLGHDFFAGVSWDDMRNKRCNPPFNVVQEVTDAVAQCPDNDAAEPVAGGDDDGAGEGPYVARSVKPKKTTRFLGIIDVLHLRRFTFRRRTWRWSTSSSSSYRSSAGA